MSDWVTEDGAWALPAAPCRGATMRDSRCVLELARGAIEVTSIEDSVLRIRFARSLPFSRRPSRAVIAESSGSAVLGGDEAIARVSSGAFALLLDRATCRMVLSGPGGPLFSGNGPFLLGRDSISLSARLEEGESIYGLGEKTGFLDRRGRRFEMWNTDDPTHTPDKDPLYQSIPFLVRFDGRRASGLFLDSTARSVFDLGFSDPDRLRIEVGDDEMDLYFFEGPTIASVVAAYARLTGTMRLPPRWALGFGQSRWSYYPDSRVIGIAKEFRERDIPCDSIYLDIDHMDGYRVFTWNGARFPDPAGMCAELGSMGFRAVAIVDPGVKKDARFPLYVEGARDGRFCLLPDGSIYHGRVWPGEAAYPDFSSSAAREWWARAHAPLLGQGVSGIWCDMNEPSDFSTDAGRDRRKATVPDDLMSDEDGDPRPFSLSHNAYGLDMCRAAVRAFETHSPGRRPFVLTRSGYAGIQRYAAVWTGDSHAWWEQLAQSMPMLLGKGLSGLPFVGGDAGGFQGDADAELYIRWMQLAAMTPFFRAHASIHSKAREPWSFGSSAAGGGATGSEAEAAARDAIRLRYSLLPYIYSEFRRASLDGLPVMRPLVLDFQGDPRARGLCDEFLLGRSLLVAPVTRPGDRERLVYLPGGLWYDYFTGEAIEGGRSVIAEAPLGRIPIFAKAGSVVPLAESAPSTAAMDFSRLRLRAYAGGEGSFELYEDDGESLAYLEGAYDLTRLSISRNASGEWELGREALHRGFAGGCASPELELIGGPWKTKP
ncbi:MAG: glycoside hydrolase family 31 protein [Spirochaetaceae bacterium]|nr:glycoside hydrolase family 31 protein [Spirochaetaceae bacterium]